MACGGLSALHAHARDASQVINRHRLYDLKAVPCLYLLDADKRVLLKDVTVEHLELYLREHARNLNLEMELYIGIELK